MGFTYYFEPGKMKPSFCLRDKASKLIVIRPSEYWIKKRVEYGPCIKFQSKKRMGQDYYIDVVDGKGHPIDSGEVWKMLTSGTSLRFRKKGGYNRAEWGYGPGRHR